MKKTMGILFSSVALMVLVGCGGGGGSSDANSSNTPNNEDSGTNPEVSETINLNGTWKEVEKYTSITPKEFENPNEPCMGIKAESIHTIANNKIMSVSGEAINFIVTRNGKTSISCKIEQGESTDISEPLEPIKWNEWVCEEDEFSKECEFTKKISKDKFISTSKTTEYLDGKILYETISQSEFTRIK